RGGTSGRSRPRRLARARRPEHVHRQAQGTRPRRRLTSPPVPASVACLRGAIVQLSRRLFGNGWMTTEQEGGAAIRTPDQRLRVFVSSTLVELAHERAAAAGGISGVR